LLLVSAAVAYTTGTSEKLEMVDVVEADPRGNQLSATSSTSAGRRLGSRSSTATMTEKQTKKIGSTKAPNRPSGTRRRVGIVDQHGDRDSLDASDTQPESSLVRFHAT